MLSPLTYIRSIHINSTTYLDIHDTNNSSLQAQVSSASRCHIEVLDVSALISLSSLHPSVHRFSCWIISTLVLPIHWSPLILSSYLRFIFFNALFFFVSRNQYTSSILDRVLFWSLNSKCPGKCTNKYESTQVWAFVILLLFILHPPLMGCPLDKASAFFIGSALW